jgi:hypothetical protein
MQTTKKKEKEQAEKKRTRKRRVRRRTIEGRGGLRLGRRGEREREVREGKRKAPGQASSSWSRHSR